MSGPNVVVTGDLLTPQFAASDSQAIPAIAQRGHVGTMAPWSRPSSWDGTITAWCDQQVISCPGGAFDAVRVILANCNTSTTLIDAVQVESSSNVTNLYPSVSVGMSASITTGSANVTLTGGANTNNIRIGQRVYGSSGIPAGAYVVSVTSSTVFVISANATASASITVNVVWQRVTFNGSNTVTLAAGTSAIQPSYTVSDWVPCPSLPRDDGKPFPYLYIRTQCSNGFSTTGLTNASVGNGAYLGDQYWQCYTAGADRTESYANLGSTSWTRNYLCSNIAGVQILYRGKTITLSVVGDSTDFGSLGYAPGLPGSMMAAFQLGGINYHRNSLSGQKSSEWTADWLNQVAIMRPDYLALRVGSSNDGYFSSGDLLAGSFADACKLLHACAQYGVTPIFFSPLPYGTMTAAMEANRQKLISRLREYAANHDYVDYDAALVDYSGAVPAIKPALRADTTHPNGAGYAAMVTPWQTVLQKALTTL